MKAKNIKSSYPIKRLLSIINQNFKNDKIVFFWGTLNRSWDGLCIMQGTNLEGQYDAWNFEGLRFQKNIRQISDYTGLRHS
jgi:hypothetical protein